MKTLLISAIGGDIGYGTIKALKAYFTDMYIIGFDIREYNVSRNLVDRFYVAPPYSNTTEWINFVTSLIHLCSVDYFWPITESEIKLVNKNKHLFECTKVVINDDKILNIALNKKKTAYFLKENGLLTPETWGAKEENNEKYPIVVKENFGCGSHFVRIVKSKLELEAALAEMREPIIQEYVGDNSEEYTLTVFSDGTIINYIAFRRELGFGGMSCYVELVNDEILKEMAYSMARLFNLKGSINVQMRKVDQRYFIFEINPRISSTIGFRFRLGFNDVAWWIRMLDGGSIPEYDYPSQKVYGVRSVEEMLFPVTE